MPNVEVLVIAGVGGAAFIVGMVAGWGLAGSRIKSLVSERDYLLSRMQEAGARIIGE